MTKQLVIQKQSKNEYNKYKKLVLIPGGFDYLGGALISLLLLTQGFKECNSLEKLCILVWADSLTDKYLKDAGYADCMQIIAAENEFEFIKLAFRWLSKQPKEYPLLLDNWADRRWMPLLMMYTPIIKLSDRPVYHFCHDLLRSYNVLGALLRKVVFSSLEPKAICNSEFTAEHIYHLMPNIQGVLYQPVDLKRFNSYSHNGPPPTNLQSILNSGARIILTPSRLNKPRIVNDKNLRALIPVLAQLKAMGHFFHGVIIGPDESKDGSYSRDLLERAAELDVLDRFTILPATLNIEHYYKYADIVVTLAPREPFGRTVVEAIACGVPVIGSSTGGINEILQNFAPEWTVDPRNPIAAAETIARVLSDANTPNLLKKGQTWVEANCNVAHYAQKMMYLIGL